ncbi:hypothetical protein [Dyadobacter sp. 32]|uniref:hypothetical protein n=1 Tax=Dyadobacter sp. 32 TaxID=538966 RepID=UPI0011EE9F4B
MLTSLSNTKKEVAEMVLVKLTESLLPNPFVDPTIQETTNPLHNAVLSEIRRKSGLNKNDISETAKTAILKKLSSELSDLVLSVDKKRNALNRIQQKRTFNQFLISYEFEFAKFEQLGMTKLEIEDAISNPDLSEHLNEIINIDEDKSTMIFVKELKNKSNDETYTLLVHVERNADILMFSAAWRIFSSDVVRNEYETPSELLKKFIDKKGLFFKISKSFKKKLVIEETPFLVASPIVNPVLAVKIIDESRETYLCLAIRRVPSVNVMKVRLAYVMNITSYKRSLREHGFKIAD